MTDHLHQLAVFHAVAEAGTFRGASRALGISPSVVSHHITHLEEFLGLPLFYRSTRRISLTDAGVELLYSARRMTQAAENGIAAMHRRKMQPAGRLKIAAPDVMQHPACGGCFIAFAKKFPHVTLDIDFSDHFVDLSGSTFDLALRGTALNMKDSNYKSKRIAQYQIWLAASPSYVNSQSVPQSMADLAEYDRIGHPPGITLSNIYNESPGEIPPVESRISMSVSTIIAALSCAREGMGYLAAPSMFLEEEIDEGILVRFCPNIVFKPINLYAVWPANVSRDSPVHLVTQFIENYEFSYREGQVSK